MSRQITNDQSGEDGFYTAAEIFEQYGDYIKAVIGFLTKNQFRQDDCYQDFFLALVRCPVPTDVENIKSYLYRAIRRDIIDSTRQEIAERQRTEKYAQESRISIYNHTSTDAIILGDERVSMFKYLTRHLCRREATVVTLRFRDNLSIAEIADRMGVNERSVARYLTAALRRLRRGYVIE